MRPAPEFASLTTGSTLNLIRAMPKVELHCHLEGSMSPTTVGLLAARHGADTSEIWPHGMPEKFSFDGFPDFARQFFFGLRLLRDGDDLQTAVVALGADLAANNVRYAEITTTVYTHLTGGMPAADYGAALSDGRRLVLAEFGIELAWVIDIHATSRCPTRCSPSTTWPQPTSPMGWLPSASEAMRSGSRRSRTPPTSPGPAPSVCLRYPTRGDRGGRQRAGRTRQPGCRAHRPWRAMS